MSIVSDSIIEVTFINVMLKTMLVLQKSDKNGWNGTKMSIEDWSICIGSINTQQPAQEKTS